MTSPNLSQRLAPAAALAGVIAVIVSVATLGSAPAAAAEFELGGPLRARDMMAFHLTRLEMVPATRSAVLGEADGRRDDGAGRGGAAGRKGGAASGDWGSGGRWTFEVELTHVNTFAKSGGVLTYLARRGPGRRPVTARDVPGLLAIPGDVFYVDGEFGMVTPTFHYQLDERRSFFLSWPAYYFSGGSFDSPIEGFHHAFGLGNGDRQFVSQNQFRLVYRIGREQVVEIGAPAGGLSDPILGLRWRLLPPSSRWDLVAQLALKIASRSPGALSSGGSDLGIQLALHRVFGRRGRQGVYLDLSVVRLGGPFPDGRVDRPSVPAIVAAYELGLTHRTSLVAQLYSAPSVFRRSRTVALTQQKFEILGGLRHRRGPLLWHLAIIENFVHLGNTPDVGAQIGVTCGLGGS